MKSNRYSPARFKKFPFLTLFIFNNSVIWDVEVVEQVKMGHQAAAKATAVAAAADVTV